MTEPQRNASDSPVADETDEEELAEDALEPFREVPVGTNDPNIIGDAGPFDVPPGSDGHSEDEYGG